MIIIDPVGNRQSHQRYAGTEATTVAAAGGTSPAAVHCDETTTG